MEQILKSGIEEKIKELIKRLDKVEDDYYLSVYKILKQILELRQSHISNYKIATLSHEEGIKYSPQQVLYLFTFDYATPRSWELINSGKLRASTFIFIMRRSTQFRNSKIQDKLIEKYMDGELTSSMISHLNSQQILHFVDSSNEMSDYDKIVLETLYALRRINNKIIRSKKLFENSAYKKKFFDALETLNVTVEEFR